MKKSLTIALFLFANLYLIGQPIVFNKNFGSSSEDVGFTSVIVSSGGYATLGWTEGTANGLSDFYLVRTDEDGNELWNKKYGLSNRESGLSIIESTSGGFILGGSSRSLGNGLSDCIIYRTDINGNELWHKTFGFPYEDYLRSINELPNGEILLCGYTENSNGDKNLLTAKLSANGDMVWWGSHGGSNHEEGWSVTADNFGNCYFGGWTQSTSNGNSDFLLVKKSYSGETIFEYSYGGNNVDSGQSLLVEGDIVIFAGSSHSFGSGKSDVLLLKLDLDGNTISQKSFGGTKHDYCRRICKTSSGYALTGYTENFSAKGLDIFVAFADDDLNVYNHTVIYEEQNQEAWDIDYQESNTFIVTGKGILADQSDNDMRLIKLNYYAVGSLDLQIDDWNYLPNPSSGIINLHGFNNNDKLLIYDQVGRKISTLSVTDSTVDLSHLSSGIYYIAKESRRMQQFKKLVLVK